eukprot:9264429-Karenia_brevis.AAC.1
MPSAGSGKFFVLHYDSVEVGWGRKQWTVMHLSPQKDGTAVYVRHAMNNVQSAKPPFNGWVPLADASEAIDNGIQCTLLGLHMDEQM